MARKFNLLSICCLEHTGNKVLDEAYANITEDTDMVTFPEYWMGEHMIPITLDDSSLEPVKELTRKDVSVLG